MKNRQFPYMSLAILGLIILGCIFAGVISTKDPTFLDLAHCNEPPSGEFLFGTDSLGRDIFSAIWHGGRISVVIGIMSAAISAVIAVFYGTVSGMSPTWVDGIMMRFVEIILSVPNLLLVLFLQAILGKAGVFSLSLVLGITGWPSIAKVVRTEVRQLRNSEFVVASRSIGAGFFHILRRHLAPNFVAGIMFMVVMNVRNAIIAESTLSFMGMGLPIALVSWGSMLSLSEGALMSSAWWVIVIPGVFLVTFIFCITNVANWLRRRLNPGESLI